MKRFLLFALMCASLLTTWADEPFRLHRYSAFTTLRTNQNSIVFIGNSITNMHEWWEAFGNPNICGRGNSGAVSDETLANFETAIAGHPAKIFLMIGTNDLGTAGINTPDHVLTNVKAMLERATNESPTTEIYIQSILPTNVGIRQMADIQATNTGLKALCQEYGATYIDLFTKLSAIPQSTAGGLSYDGLHLTMQGYRIWCNAIAEYVGSNCVYPATAVNQNGGQGGAYGMRITSFAALPVKSQDVLFIGDEMVHGGEWHELFHSDRIKNRGTGWGYPGPALSLTLAEIPLILQGRSDNEQPAKILLYAGVGDVNGSTAMATVVSNYRAIVDKIRQLAPNTHLYLLALHPTNNATTNTGRVIPFNAELKTMAESLDGVDFIDTYTPFVSSNVANRTLFSGNYLYGKGYARMTQVLAPYLTEEGVTPTTDEEADSLIAIYAARNTLGSATSVAATLPIGEAMGEYHADTVAAFNEIVTEAYQLLKNDATTEEINAFTPSFTERANALRETINQPLASNDSVEYWYTICSTLRENRYIAATAYLGSLEGRLEVDSAAMWKFVERADGKGYDIVNRKYGSYVNPICNFGNQFKTRSTAPVRAFQFSWAATPYMFIIRTNTGNAEMNQTTSANSYKIFNWSSGQDGKDRTDAGCQFTLSFVEETITALPCLPAATYPNGATTGETTIYDLQGRRMSNPENGIYIQGGKKVYLKP